jgi:hypothetical protein
LIHVKNGRFDHFFTYFLQLNNQPFLRYTILMGEPSMDFVGGIERERRLRKRVRSLPEIERDREKVKESLKLGEQAKEQGEAVA